ncbi:MAG: hypothetical protein LQ346_007752 [Caloplaca aetnensis]|nr:MAG: hypothetical protein LQ346_007752 [Caloplaca aetnensis]
MADPLSAILVVANVLALTDNFYRGVQFVRKVAQDPKVDGMFVRLITEKARYAEWKRRMGVETPEDFKTLITLLPADARESLPRILAPIEKYVGVAERLFVKYGISAPDATDVNRTLKDKMRRLNLLMDGQQQVHDILETLKNCNDGLLTIAPPAPGYYVSLAGNDPILETADQASDVLEGPQTRWQPAISTSDGREGSMSSDAQCIIPPSPIQEPSRRVFHSVIELLHSTCLRVLRSIAERYPDHRTRFQEAGDRLQIWGTGLFHGQISIDQALNQKSAAVKLLRNNIAGTLADIAEVIRKWPYPCSTYYAGGAGNIDEWLEQYWWAQEVSILRIIAD